MAFQVFDVETAVRLEDKGDDRAAVLLVRGSDRANTLTRSKVLSSSYGANFDLSNRCHSRDTRLIRSRSPSPRMMKGAANSQ